MGRRATSYRVQEPTPVDSIITYPPGAWDAEISLGRIDRAVQILAMESLYPWLN